MRTERRAGAQVRGVLNEDENGRVLWLFFGKFFLRKLLVYIRHSANNLLFLGTPRLEETDTFEIQ